MRSNVTFCFKLHKKDAQNYFHDNAVQYNECEQMDGWDCGNCFVAPQNGTKFESGWTFRKGMLAKGLCVCVCDIDDPNYCAWYHFENFPHRDSIKIYRNIKKIRELSICKFLYTIHKCMWVLESAQAQYKKYT